MLAHLNGHDGGNGNDQDQELRFRKQFADRSQLLVERFRPPASLRARCE